MTLGILKCHMVLAKTKVSKVQKCMKFQFLGFYKIQRFKHIKGKTCTYDKSLSA